MKARDLSDREKKELSAQIHEGVPNAKVEFSEVLHIRLEEGGKRGGDTPGQTPEQDDPDQSQERLRISLDSLDVNIHNQSFGMISASTGCISNPGGPSC